MLAEPKLCEHKSGHMIDRGVPEASPLSARLILSEEE